MLLEIAQLSRSTFYHHNKQQTKEDKYAQAKMEIASYNNRRIKARLKGLPPILHRQQALSAA